MGKTKFASSAEAKDKPTKVRAGSPSPVAEGRVNYLEWSMPHSESKD